MTTAPNEREATIPTTLDDGYPELRRRFEAATHLLCCLDFDGTLAPIVDDPDEARIPAETRRTLERLHRHPAVTVAIVSGRSLADLRRRIDLPVSLIGNHGMERYEPAASGDSSVTGRSVHPLAAAAIPRIEACFGILEPVLDSIPNAAVEYKGLTGTVHYRNVPKPLQPTCKRLAADALERFGGGQLSISEGNAIVEFGPAIDWGKGDAVELLRSERPANTAVLVCGDDTTDEDAFRAVGSDGITVRVGPAEPSYGTYRTASPTTLARLLQWVADEGTELLSA